MIPAKGDTQHAALRSDWQKAWCASQTCRFSGDRVSLPVRTKLLLLTKSDAQCATAYSRVENDATLLAHCCSDHLLDVLGLNRFGVPSFGWSAPSAQTLWPIRLDCDQRVQARRSDVSTQVAKVGVLVASWSESPF